MRDKFSVKGMTCSACSAGIERAVKRLGGVQKAEVSLMGECMLVEYDEAILSREDIMRTVIDLGYGASIYDERLFQEKKPQPDKLKKRFLFSLFFLIALMYLSMGHMVFLPVPPAVVNFPLQAALALIVIIINFKFYTSGVKALIKRVPNMDTLVAMGSAISFAYSFVLTIIFFSSKDKTNQPHLFYESAAMILGLVTLGKWLEEKSKRKTGDEIEKLIQLMPNTVTAIRDGVERKIPFADVQTGDIIVVKQGEYVPVDGKVTEGHGFVDRAAITGESMPLEVFEGCQVTGADIVKSGFIKVKAEKVGADTTLSQIVKMVKEAGASKAPLQKIADGVSAVFVPLVTCIALITFVVWLLTTGDVSKAANYAISVLVISCPCSLGLATPVAVMAATGKGMSLGILYKNAEALQKAKDINCVLLDKTATLTVGNPEVTDFVSYADEKRVLRLAYAIEIHSNHPIAECVRDYAQRQVSTCDFDILNYHYEVGKGATGVFEGENYRLGNRRLLGKIDEKKAFALEKEYSKQGKTAVFLADDTKLIAVFAVADVLKEESKSAIAELKSKGIRVGMLTGDNENVAQAIAQEVGIDDYFAEALPEDKKAAIERVRSVGGFVAMVGDGINDSPALKEADVGIAMGNGTDVAMDAAEIVLSRGDLRLIATAIDLSRKTVRNIKENFFWAFFYNCIAIPVAAGVFAFAGFSLNPMIGSLCMSLSSLCVVLNALRLTRFGNKKDKNITEVSMKKTLKIEGMMCQHCVAHVTKALQNIDGVTNVEVNLKKKTAVVELSGLVKDETMISAVTEAGYTVKKIS